MSDAPKRCTCGNSALYVTTAQVQRKSCVAAHMWHGLQKPRCQAIHHCAVRSQDSSIALRGQEVVHSGEQRLHFGWELQNEGLLLLLQDAG